MVYDCILFINLILLVCVDHSCLKYWPNDLHCTSTKPKEDGMEPFLAGGPDASGCLYKQFWLSMRSSIWSGDRLWGAPVFRTGCVCNSFGLNGSLRVFSGFFWLVLMCFSFGGFLSGIYGLGGV